MIKKTIFASMVVLVGTSALHADVEDDIFKSGVTRTLQVLEYQKKLSEESAESFNNRLCYYINPKDGDTQLSDFQVIKLEALSMIAKTKPLYYQDDKGKKHLCFFVSKSEEAYEASKNLIEDKFDDIKLYHPKKVKLSSKTGIKPILPKLGEWHLDMSGTIETLNQKISTLNKAVKSKDKALKRMRQKIKDIVKAVQDISEASAEEIKETKKAYREMKKHQESKKKAESKKQTKKKLRC